MNKFLILLSLTLAAPVFAAPAGKSNVAVKRSNAKQNQAGKSALVAKDFAAPKRPYRIVPMISMASFRLAGTQGLDNVRSDDGIGLSVLGDYDYGPVTLQGGLSYYQMGARGNGVTENNVPVDFKVNLEYLALTAGAKYYFMKRQIYGKASLSPAFKMRSETKVTSPIRRTDELNNVRDMDVIFAMGGGVEVPFYKHVKVGGELTYNRGLIDATTHGNGQVFNEGFLFSAFLNL